MNKFKWHCAVISFILCSTVLASSVPTTPGTAPTSSSTPLPTLQSVRNIDSVLTESVQAEIAKSPSLKGQSVSAVSHDQIITLEGSVETKNQENDAISIAKQVSGVKEVKSQLTIKGLQNR
jgi:hypothetical protein